MATHDPTKACAADADACYHEATLQLLLGQPGAAELFDRVLALDEGFALAHLGRSIALQEVGHAAEAARSRAIAASLAESAGPQAQRLIEGVVALQGGDAARGVSLLDTFLSEFPGNAIALEQLTGFLFFHGGRGKKARVLDLLDRVAAAYPSDDAYLGSRRAFHLQEVGRHAESRAEAERVLARDGRSATAAHALVHVSLQQGAAAEGLAFLTQWLSGYLPGGRLHGHLWWHVALFELELGRASAAARHFFAHVRPKEEDGPRPLALADAAGLLWRMDLYGVAEPDGWACVHQLARHFAASAGRPFLVLHAAMALAAVGDERALDDLERGVEQRAQGGDRLAADVTLPLASGMRAFRRGDYVEAIARLGSVSPEAREGAGGSNVERDVFEQTLIEACLRAGRFEEARSLVLARVTTAAGGRETARAPVLPARAPGGRETARAPTPRERLWLDQAELGMRGAEQVLSAALSPSRR